MDTCCHKANSKYTRTWFQDKTTHFYFLTKKERNLLITSAVYINAQSRYAMPISLPVNEVNAIFNRPEIKNGFERNSLIRI